MSKKAQILDAARRLPALVERMEVAAAQMEAAVARLEAAQQPAELEEVPTPSGEGGPLLALPAPAELPDASAPAQPSALSPDIQED